MNEPRKPAELGQSDEWLRNALRLSDGETPFPWQEQLLAKFMKGEIERSLDIPTGLGKTAVMAIWLIARARSAASLPRRLVYVVDRRAVVDQATTVATSLREWVDADPEVKQGLGLEERSLPISTLRGQYVDNKEWLVDPAAPAIIVGTVDMVGSRLLFEGYGTSRKMRPYHAGLLGSDTLFMLDEAHLVPPFERLLASLADGVAAFGPKDAARQELIPKMHFMSLSATSRSPDERSFGLTDADASHREVHDRLHARKRITLEALADGAKLADELAERAWALSERGAAPIRCIAFTEKRTDAQTARKKLTELAKKDGVDAGGFETELFVGARRVYERHQAAERLEELGFIAGRSVARERPVFLFATSAGEVGVDLDAEHMVSDLVSWERMVQRLGRVNRRGKGDAEVVVLVEPEPKPPKSVQKIRVDRPKKLSKAQESALAKFDQAVAAWHATQRPFEELPPLDGGVDGSPGALQRLKMRAAEDPALHALLEAATSEAPLRPPLSRALVDAWAMTSLEVHTGRPEVEPWLRGWLPNEAPQTSVAWRRHLPVQASGAGARGTEVERFFEAAPIHVSEMLQADAWRVAKDLSERARAVSSSRPKDDEGSGSSANPLEPSTVVAIALTPAGDFVKQWTLEELREASGASGKDALAVLERDLAGNRFVVDARIGGLDEGGLLDPGATQAPPTIDERVEEDCWTPALSTVGFRVRVCESAEAADERQKGWRERYQFVVKQSEDAEPTRLLVVDKWKADGTTEDDRSFAGRPQPLEEHLRWTERAAARIADRLGLDPVHAEMLKVAAVVHDEGKRASRWQRAFNAPEGKGAYAKTRGPVSFALLDGYRHELGSLPFAAEHPRFQALPEELRELVLHIVVAHHGFGRPVISPRSCDDGPPSTIEARVREVALRFARLQREWGPWGLAWWEALLRAADQQASRENDEKSDSREEGN